MADATKAAMSIGSFYRRADSRLLSQSSGCLVKHDVVGVKQDYLSG